MGKISHVSTFTKTGYSKETGTQGILTWNENFNWKAMGWTETSVKEAKELIEKWNNGERWI